MTGHPHSVHVTSSGDEVELMSSIYGFLALTMRYPEQSFCDDQYLEAFKDLLSSLEWQDELDAIERWQRKTANLIDDLQIAYTKLFINSAPGSTIPPYASVYRDGDRCIQGKTTEKIKDFYRDCGFEVVESTEPEDHIQHELEFLAALARDNNQEKEATFLTTLFRPWFIQFRTQFLAEARHPFYRVSIQLIDFFTKEEQ